MQNTDPCWWAAELPHEGHREVPKEGPHARPWGLTARGFGDVMLYVFSCFTFFVQYYAEQAVLIPSNELVMAVTIWV